MNPAGYLCTPGVKGRVGGRLEAGPIMMSSSCPCIVAIHILKERHRLQKCSNGGTTTSHQWSVQVCGIDLLQVVLITFLDMVNTQRQQ